MFDYLLLFFTLTMMGIKVTNNKYLQQKLFKILQTKLINVEIRRWIGIKVNIVANLNISEEANG